MKKFISFAAYALLASALTCSLTACSSDDDQTDVSDPKAKVKAWLTGNWRHAEYTFGDGDAIDGIFAHFAADGTYKRFQHYKHNDLHFPNQYIAENNQNWTWDVEPDEEDPTQGIIRLYLNGEIFNEIPYKDFKPGESFSWGKKRENTLNGWVWRMEKMERADDSITYQPLPEK